MWSLVWTEFILHKRVHRYPVFPHLTDGTAEAFSPMKKSDMLSHLGERNQAWAGTVRTLDQGHGDGGVRRDWGWGDQPLLSPGVPGHPHLPSLPRIVLSEIYLMKFS